MKQKGLFRRSDLSICVDTSPLLPPKAAGLGSRRLSSLDDWAGGRNFDLPLGFLGTASHVVATDREGFHG